MLFEAVIGCGSFNPCRLLADYLLACQLGHRRPCGEWLKRGLHCRKWVCLPCFQVETERGEVGVVAIQSGKHQVPHRRPHSCGMDSSLHEYKLRQR